jgi:heptosyltransferase-2
MKRLLVVQTAFPGDIVLVLPVLQALRERVPGAHILFLTTPRGGELVAHHPAVDDILVYDKRGSDAGVSGFLRMVRRVRAAECDAAVIPHRSLRSAAVCAAAGIPVRIGFSTSAGRMLLTRRVPYNGSVHEVRRNLDLLRPLGIEVEETALPVLHPGAEDQAAAREMLGGARQGAHRLIALAPGSVWATKRWPEERFGELAAMLVHRGDAVVLVGGADDAALCERIRDRVGSVRVRSAAGRLSLTGSAALLALCDALVSNDSAPAHLAVAVGTRVVTLFGATVPAFGFGPLGPRDAVVETPGLSCRPCAIHGGPRCPIGTFECMLSIGPEQVLRVLDAGEEPA